MPSEENDKTLLLDIPGSFLGDCVDFHVQFPKDWL